MNRIRWHGLLRRLPLTAAVSLFVVVVFSAVWFCDDAAAGEGPSLDEMHAAERAISRIVYPAGRPGDLRLRKGFVPWLCGKREAWNHRASEVVMRWVAEGNVCWVNLEIAPSFGLECGVGGGTDLAVVAEGIGDHPLAAGVRRVKAGDTFLYLHDLPDDALAIVNQHNNDGHAVVAVWPIGKGYIIFRPQRRRDPATWLFRGERRWIAPNMADGRRLLHNLNMFTLSAVGHDSGG